MLPAREIGADHRWPLVVSAAIVAISVLQAAALATIARCVPGRPGPFVLTGAAAGALAMLWSAFAAPTLTTNDPWAYIGFAKIGSFVQAYVPPNRPFLPPYSAITLIWHQPMISCPYGPVWLAFDRALLAPTRDLASGLAALRAAGIAEYAICAMLLLALRCPARMVLLFVLNPAIVMQSVDNAHNDLFGIVFVLLGMAVAARSRPLGLAIGTVAVFVKVSLLFAVIVALVDAPSRRARIVQTLGIVVLAVAGSAALGGAPYAHALARELGFGGGDRSGAALLDLTTHALVALTALAALVAAVAFDRREGGAAWSFASLSGRFYPSYLIWGFPYALRCGEYAATFLIVLPVADAMLNFAFPGSGMLARLAILAYAAISLLTLVSGPSRRTRRSDASA